MYFFQTFRMDSSTFDILLSWVGPLISKSSLRCPVASPTERLTWRYLATGQGHIELEKDYRISPATVGRVVIETCKANWDVIIERGYQNVPNSNEEWKEIARDFEAQWNFPHCIGAIDGKHIMMIQAPARSGSTYFNYKKTFSIVLMAICDGNYSFTMADIGDAGRQNDAGVYSSSQIGRAIEHNKLKIPNPEPLIDYDNTVFPYCFVSDEAFSLKPHMMRPYPRH